MRTLSAQFPGSVNVGLLGDQLVGDDRAIFEFAKANRFVVVTRDKDFAHMCNCLTHAPKVIHLVVRNLTAREYELLLRSEAKRILAFQASPARVLVI